MVHALMTLGVSAQSATGLSGCAPCRLCRHGHSASIPHAFAPAVLRALLAAKGSAQGPPPPCLAWRSLRMPNRCVPDRPGQRPAAMGWALQVRRSFLCRLCECVPSTMLVSRCLVVTTDGSQTCSLVWWSLQMALPAWPPYGAGARSHQSLMALAHLRGVPVKQSRGDIEPARLLSGVAQGGLGLL